MKKQRNTNRLLMGLTPVIVLVGCIAFSLFSLQGYRKQLEKEEQQLPTYAVYQYLDALKNQDYETIYQTSLQVAPHINSQSSYINRLKETFDGVQLSEIQAILTEEVSQDELVYDLVADKTKLATLICRKVNGDWLASTTFDGSVQIVVEAPKGASFTINGFDPEPYLEDSNAVAHNFRGLDDPKEAPKVERYEFSGLIEPPIIEVNDGLTLIKDALSDTYYLGKVGDEELEDVFEKAAYALARFPTKDGSLSAITSITVPKSDFYNRIRTLDNQWFAPHNSATFENTHVKHLTQQSEDTVIGNVITDYTLTASRGVTRTYHIGYQLTFMKMGNTWKIAGIAIDNEME